MFVLNCTLLSFVLYLNFLSAIRQLDELCKSKVKNGSNGIGEIFQLEDVFVFILIDFKQIL